MCAIPHLVYAVAAHGDHVATATDLMDQPFVFHEIRPLIWRYPGAVAVRSEAHITKPQRLLFALHQATNKMGRERTGLPDGTAAVGNPLDAPSAFVIVQF